jgi:uncharacterized protein YjiK
MKTDSRFLIIILLLAALVTSNHSFLTEQLFSIQSNLRLGQKTNKSGLGINQYQAIIQAKEVSGVHRNLSGLTYNAETDTLFSVINHPPSILELNKAGVLLRKIPVDGVVDLEGITHIKGDEFVITDESDQRIIQITVSNQTKHIKKDSLSFITLSIDHSDNNKGFEGVEWDASTKTLFVVKEKHPKKVYLIKGFPYQKNQFVEIKDWSPFKNNWASITDLSSIFIHRLTGNIILLGEESKRIAEYQPQGDLVSVLNLKAGKHGLNKSVPQAEGIAIDQNDNIYLVSEPNLFYKFSKPTQQNRRPSS